MLKLLQSAFVLGTTLIAISQYSWRERELNDHEKSTLAGSQLGEWEYGKLCYGYLDCGQPYSSCLGRNPCVGYAYSPVSQDSYLHCGAVLDETLRCRKMGLDGICTTKSACGLEQGQCVPLGSMDITGNTDCRDTYGSYP